MIELEGIILGVVLDGKMVVVDGMVCVFDLFIWLIMDGIVIFGKDIFVVVIELLLEFIVFFINCKFEGWMFIEEFLGFLFM